MAGRETSIPKGSVSHCRSRIHRAFSHIAHKRRNVRFKRLRRVHTPPQPPAPNRAHSGSHGETRGVSDGGWYHYPRSVLRGSETLRGRVSERRTLPLSGLGRGESRRTQRACGTAMRSLRVAVPRRRGPAGLRDPVAVPLTALIGFTILLSRIVAHRKLSACSLVTAVRFLNRCLRRSMRETYPLGQRSGCRS